MPPIPVRARFAPRLFALLLLVGLQSCAAMFTGTKSDVRFSAYPEGATVLIADEEQPAGHSYRVSKKLREVTFRHPDFPERTVPVGRNFQGGFLLLDLLFTPGFGLLGILIDGATGAWWKLEPEVHCNFEEPLDADEPEEPEEPAAEPELED